MVGYALLRGPLRPETLPGGAQAASTTCDELGVRHVHLMPLPATREGDNDGGYAVTDYGAVRPDLGTLDDLEEVAATACAGGASAPASTSSSTTRAAEHEWAVPARRRRARSTRPCLPDLPRIARDARPLGGGPFRRSSRRPRRGNFTRLAGRRAGYGPPSTPWQWDLDWANPRGLLRDARRILLDLANRGRRRVPARRGRLHVEAPGHELPEPARGARTSCSALRGLRRIAAPAVIFKAEAIVGPDDLAPYLGVAAPGVAHARAAEPVAAIDSPTTTA